MPKQSTVDFLDDQIGRLDAEVARLRNALGEMHGHLLSARRYVHAYTENEGNHPQARDNANSLIHQIDTSIAKLK